MDDSNWTCGGLCGHKAIGGPCPDAVHKIGVVCKVGESYQTIKIIVHEDAVKALIFLPMRYPHSPLTLASPHSYCIAVQMPWWLKMDNPRLLVYSTLWPRLVIRFSWNGFQKKGLEEI